LQTYGVTNLFEDIKSLYKIAGFKGQPVCFIFTDAEVKDEAFLEYINQILMTGEVAGECSSATGTALLLLSAEANNVDG
jgi:dynein heavy chain